MAAYWTIKKDEDIEDIKTIRPYQEEKVGGNEQQLPPDPKEEEPRQQYHCSECKAVIHKGDVFCPQCGKKLENYDFEE